MNDTTTERPPYGLAALTTAVVFTIYALTLAPTTQFWDTSEYIAAAKVLGIPHPPGNPLFVLLANAWGRLPFSDAYAFRINLFAAVTSALASGFLFLVADRWLRPVIPAAKARAAAAFAGVLVGATMFTVWNQSVVNEKVYTVSLLSIALILWLGVHWADAAPGWPRDRLMLLIGYLLALTSTNHMMGVLAAAAVAVYVVVTDWREAIRPTMVLFGLLLALAVFGGWFPIVNGPMLERVIVLGLLAAAIAYVAAREPEAFRSPTLYLAVLAVLIGISLNYTFLPLRAAQFPPINEGEPTTWHALWAVLTRQQYQKPPVWVRMAHFPSQLGNYLQYFSWQFGKDLVPSVRNALAAAFGLIGLGGAVVQWRKDRRAAAAMTAMMVTLTLVLIYYLNFRYGYSYHAGQDLDREVRERDYFFVVSFQLWGVWTALGLGGAWAMFERAFRERTGRASAWLMTAPVLIVAIVPIFTNRLTASRAGETLARDFAVDMLQSVEPYAIVITAGDNDLFPLWHAQEVQGVRRDVTVLNQSLMNTDWHLKQILRRPLATFDVEHAAAPYQDMDPPKPDTPPFSIPISGIDSLPLLFRVEQRSVLRVGEMSAVLEPNVYDRSTLITLQVIRDNLGKRPIYFARTTGNTPDQLGLSDYLLSQGFVRRVMPRAIEASDSVQFVRGVGWIDLRRTEQLLFDVYHPEAAARARPRGWIDEPSANILSLYYVTYGVFGEIVKALPDSVRTPELQREAKVSADLAERMLKSLHFTGP
jgi:Protein O-mannosyl-transferase TMEM260-like